MKGPIPVQRPMTSLDRSREIQQKNQEQKLRQAAKLYEKHFLREMVKAMRSTVKHSQLTTPSMAQKIYAQKMDEQYVEKWGEVGGIGLGEIIYRQLKERFFTPRLSRPVGPLEVPKGKVLKVPSQGGVNWLIQPEGGGKVSPSVTSPWSGSVSKVVVSEGSRATIKIEHDNSVSSLLSFAGTPNVRPGDNLATGQRLGVLAAPDSLLAWKVTNGGV